MARFLEARHQLQSAVSLLEFLQALIFCLSSDRLRSQRDL